MVMGSNSVSNAFFFPVLLLLLSFGVSSAQLSSNYYASTCPTALSVIRNVVKNAVVKEHRMGASLLRLHFHDCFVNACSLSLSQIKFACIYKANIMNTDMKLESVSITPLKHQISIFFEAFSNSNTISSFKFEG